MKALIESVASRAAGGWQRAGAKFDFEVFALPGGSVLAPVLWAYSVTRSLLQDSRHQSIDTQQSDAPTATPATCAHCS